MIASTAFMLSLLGQVRHTDANATTACLVFIFCCFDAVFASIFCLLFFFIHPLMLLLLLLKR